MTLKSRYPRIGLTILLALIIGGLSPRMVSAEDNNGGGEEDIWGMFKDIATEKFYEKLDEQFADISGVSVKEKLDRMKEAIETAEKFANYFDKVIMAEPTRKANIEALKGLADGISAVSALLKELPEPGPSLTAFFEFYAEGIYSAARMMEKLSEELRQKAIELAEIGEWDFSLYPGAISDEEIREIRKMKQQEMLARRAKVAVEAKRAHLEAKRKQIEEFVNIGYPDFIRRFVQEVQSQAGKEGCTTMSLYHLVKNLRRTYHLVFELTDPRDALEEQYSEELNNLLESAEQAINGSSDYLHILGRAALVCQAAEDELYSVKEIPDRKDDSSISGKIAEIRSKIEELRNKKISFGGDITTYDRALARFGKIKLQYLELKSEAEEIAEEAEAVLEEASNYKEEVIEEWEERGSDEEAAEGEAGIPYAIQLGLVETLSADDVSPKNIGIS